jgi:ankyrin repeat protein
MEKDKLSTLHWACGEKAVVEVVLLLLDKGVDVCARDKVRFAIIAKQKTDLAYYKDGMTPLHRALAKNAAAEVAPLLINRGADMKALDKVIFPHMVVPVQLLGLTFIGRQEKRTPLHFANRCPLGTVRLLIDGGADVQAVDEVNHGFRQNQPFDLL